MSLAMCPGGNGSQFGEHIALSLHYIMCMTLQGMWWLAPALGILRMMWGWRRKRKRGSPMHPKGGRLGKETGMILEIKWLGAAMKMVPIHHSAL